MKILRLASLFSVALLSALSAGTLETPPEITTPHESPEWACSRPDSNAPIGVMGDHLHHANEWMFGTRYMHEHSEGLMQGTDKISTSQVFNTTSPNGSHYTVAPVEMDMNMSMLEVMYAPTDAFTLMMMTGYMDMDMTMYGSMGHGAHGGGMSGHESPKKTYSHSVSGWTDSSFSVLAKLFNAKRQAAHVTLGISLPTGDDGVKGHGGNYTHYGMQLGSGSWDLLPGITYLGQTEHFSWGAQYSSILRLEEENSSGFSFGDVHQVTAWGAYKFNDWASMSTRVAYAHEGDMTGHYNGPHNHSSPMDFPSNYGGEVIDLGVGLNLKGTKGFLKNQRLSVEVLWPVWQDVNGIQLERDWTLYAGWQCSF